MRAAVLEENRKPLAIATDVDVAAPGPEEVVVKIASCGICHSDLTLIDLPAGGQLPAVLGHEAAGVVEEVGGAVKSLRRGDRVVLTPLAPCGSCYYCVRSQPTLCVEAQNFMTGARADGTSPLSRKGASVFRGFSTGGFGELALVHERAAVKVPSDTPLEVACVIGCAVQTGVGAVLNTAKVEEGATVLVTGLGGIGVAVVQGARLAGAAKIIASDPVGERRDHARHFGATHVLDPREDDVVAKAREITGGIGVDYAFDAAGSNALVQHCIQASRTGGTTVMVGAPLDPKPLEIPIPALFLTWEKKLMGSLLGSCHSHRAFPRLLALRRKGALDLEGMITRRRPIEEINQGLDDLRASRGIRTVLGF